MNQAVVERDSVKKTGAVAKAARAAKAKHTLRLKFKQAIRVAPKAMLGSAPMVIVVDPEIEVLQKAGLEARRSKETALAFLKAAGILDANGNLAEPYRA